jgi:hypothetical protein
VREKRDQFVRHIIAAWPICVAVIESVRVVKGDNGKLKQRDGTRKLAFLGFQKFFDRFDMLP